MHIYYKFIIMYVDTSALVKSSQENIKAITTPCTYREQLPKIKSKTPILTYRKKSVNVIYYSTRIFIICKGTTIH